MNKEKIQYKNRYFAKTLNEYLKTEERDPEHILELIARKYQLFKPLVTNLEISYDTIEVTLYDLKKDISLKVTIGFSINFPISIRILGKNYLSTFYLDGDTFTLNKITYEGSKNEYLIKFYTTAGNSKALIIDDNKRYFKYRYNYQNNSLNCLIEIEIKEDLEFDEVTFIKSVISNHNILDIDILYKEIKRNIIGNDFYIGIKNIIVGKEDECIRVSNGKLLDYRKYIKNNGKEEFYKYANDKLIVTRLEDIDKNFEFQKVLKML